MKDNIECHTEKQRGNPLIKAILFVIGDLFALPPRPTSSQGIWNMEKGMFGWVWLGGILTGLSIFAYRCQSAELGAAGVHKSSYAQLSKTHTNKRWRYSRIDKEKKRYGDREICMADSRIHSRKEVWYARRVAVVTNESKHTEIRCAINHRLCPVSCVLSPSADIVLLQSRSGPLVASLWRPTRRDSLNVSGHK